MRLIPIPKDKYEEYRLTLMFDCYKWDPQFVDSNTVAKYVLVITKEEHEELKKLTEKLDEETRAAEEFLNQHQELLKPLALPNKVSKEIKNMKNYEPQRHVRLMRYDFHPTMEDKWAGSEVNSDVPGVSKNSFDGRGNYTLGVREQLIFPEISYDDVSKVRGLDIVVVTTAETDEEARELLSQLGMPFQK